MLCFRMMFTPQKAQEESDASAWGAEATVEEDREERLVRGLTDILGQNKASRKYENTKTRKYYLPPTVERCSIALKGWLLSGRTLLILFCTEILFSLFVCIPFFSPFYVVFPVFFSERETLQKRSCYLQSDFLEIEFSRCSSCFFRPKKD